MAFPGLSPGRAPRGPATTGGLAILAAGIVLLLAPATAVATNINVGGWAGFLYADNDKPNTRRGFDAHPWYLYVEGDVLEGYRFFGEIEAEHVFNTKSNSGELKLERLYIERGFNTHHNVRFGKFFVPFGHWYRKHWHFLTETLSRPISFSNAYTPKFQVGVEYLGRAFVRSTSFNYYAWVGNGPDQFGTNKRSVEDFGYGGTVFVEYRHDGAVNGSLGTALGYHAQTAATPTGEEDQVNVVVAVDTRIERLSLRGEYYDHQRSELGDLSSWYVSANLLVLRRLGVNYRYDRGDDVKTAGAVDDLMVTANSVGLVWRPQAKVLLKSEFRVVDAADPAAPDYNEWNMFMGLKF